MPSTRRFAVECNLALVHHNDTRDVEFVIANEIDIMRGEDDRLATGEQTVRDMP